MTTAKGTKTAKDEKATDKKAGGKKTPAARAASEEIKSVGEILSEHDAASELGGDGVLFKGMQSTTQKDIPDLTRAILNYESYKRERIAALNKEIEQRGIVIGFMRANRADLAFNPNTGIHSYRVENYVEELLPGEEKFNSRELKSNGDGNE